MNIYEQLMAASEQDRQPASPVPVGLDAFKTNVGVDRQVGHDKLAKKPYNPYNLIQQEAEELDSRDGLELGKRKNFRKEMLRDVAE